VALARDTHQSLSQVVASLIRGGLDTSGGEVVGSARTGLPVTRVGRTITTEDIRRLQDDD
jgi:hypothetical protein